MTLSPELRLIHLQLTKRCNLRCTFCGQWGAHGYMEGSSHADLSTGEWLGVVEQAARFRDETGIAPEFVLWGGEPLLSPAFNSVGKALRKEGFRVALITNGSLLEAKADVVNETMDAVFVSLDGPAEVHDRLRHMDGLFGKVGRGMARIYPKLSRVAMFTICGENWHLAVDFPFTAARMGFGQVLFQNLIYCTPVQARNYRNWLKTSFGQDAPRLESWITEGAEPWVQRLPEVAARIQGGDYPVNVSIFPNEINAGNITQWFDASVHLKGDNSSCLMPMRHLQVAHDGEVHFCVDFNDFTLGNIRESSLKDLFLGDRARRFRAESPVCNALCARCPWFYNRLS